MFPVSILKSDQILIEEDDKGEFKIKRARRRRRFVGRQQNLPRKFLIKNDCKFTLNISLAVRKLVLDNQSIINGGIQ